MKKCFVKNVASRLQTYFCAKFFRKNKPIVKSKKGAVVLVGGGDGNMRKPYETACTLLFPFASAILAIGMAITKQIRLKNAKQIEAKFCDSTIEPSKVLTIASDNSAVFGTWYKIWVTY